jgi:hypothetical protein
MALPRGPLNPFNLIYGTAGDTRVAKISSRVRHFENTWPAFLSVFTNSDHYVRRVFDAQTASVGPRDSDDVVCEKLFRVLAKHGKTWEDSICVHKSDTHRTLSASVMLVGHDHVQLRSGVGYACEILNSTVDVVSLKRVY